MISTRLAAALTITALFTLGQGCSTTVTPPTDILGEGEESPDDSTGGEENTQGEEETETKAPDPKETTPGTPTTPTTPQEPAPPQKSKMTFFVTSTGSGDQGGNLGGLTGADKKCQDLATAVNGGDHTWHAYLSVTGTNAKDRIGAGPWTNHAGKIIAASVEALHSFQFIPSSADVLDEKGQPVPAGKNMILTGSKQDGTPVNQTCNGWTSNQQNQQGRAGDSASDTATLLGVRWNDALKNYQCTQQAITANKGEGRVYCFAID